MAGNTPSNAELAQQITALTVIVTNLANAIAINQAPPAAAVPPAAAILFATSPRVATVKELIDYTTKHGANLCEQGTKAPGTPFSMTASQVVIFEKELQDRASMMGWDKGTQNILRVTNKDSRQISLIVEYGNAPLTKAALTNAPSTKAALMNAQSTKAAMMNV